MNPATEISTETAAPSSETPSPFAYRGKGKIARLPKPVRDKISHWMLDGLSYPEIIERLGPDGKDLNPGHLCEWRKRGFQDWLLEQAFIERIRSRQEPAAGLSADFDATQLNHAALQLGTLHIFEALRDLTPTHPAYRSDHNGEGGANGEDQGESEPVPVPSPRGEGKGEGEQLAPDQPVSQIQNRKSEIENPTAPTASTPQLRPPNQKSKFKNQKSALDLRLGGDSSAFVRLINALARASRETMLVQKYREACAKAHAALTELKDPNRKLNESETRAIVRKVDEILGFPTDDNESDSSPIPPPNDAPSLASAA